MKNYLFTIFEKSNKRFPWDGRWIIFLLLVIYGSVLFILTKQTGELYLAWRKLGVFALSPTFFDWVYMEKGMDCIRKGFDIINDPSCIGLFGWNYPRIWNLLQYTFVSEQYTSISAFTLITVFGAIVFAFIRRINFTEGIGYGLILCSPPVMLAVERANPDLLIFILLAGVLYGLNRSGFLRKFVYSIILFCGLLKYYPVSAFLLSLREKKKEILIMGLLSLIIFIPYLYFSLHEMQLSNQQFEKDIWVTTGSMIFVDWLTGVLQNIVSLKPEVMHLSVWLAIALIFLFSFLQIKNQKNIPVPETKNMDSFRMGAGIFIGSFIFGYNFDYRLIFLIFTFPQMMEWCKTENPMRKISMIALSGLVFYFQYYFLLGNASRIFSDKKWDDLLIFFTFPMKEMVIWGIFVYYVYAIMRTLPDWIRIR